MTKSNNAATGTLTNVLQAMHANLPNLVTNKDYTLEQLVGKASWNAIPKSERNKLGQAFKALVKKGEQPVKWNGDRTDNSQIYQLK